MSQPNPKPNGHTPSWDLVIEDMKKRNEVGTERYGTPLQPFNGRDSLQDAYEEALDLAVYLRNAIEERELCRRAPLRDHSDMAHVYDNM